MSRDLWGYGVPGPEERLWGIGVHTAAYDPDADVFQHGGCIEYANALKQRFPHLQLGTLVNPDDPDDWQHLYMHDGTYAYDSAGRHPMPYYGVRGNLEPSEDDTDFDWYDEPDEDLLDEAHRHIEQHGIGPRTAARTAMPYDFHEVSVQPWVRRTVRAYDGENRVGEIHWGPDGQIQEIYVPEQHRRKGVGRALLEHARSLEPGLHHSLDLTEDGMGFARGTSDFMPPHTAARTAMPAPAPSNLNFKYHFDNSTIPRGHSLPDAPVVTAHLGDDPAPIGHLEWFYNDDYDYGDTPEEDLAGHGEVRYIHVKPEHRHQDVATKMFEWTKRNVIPELHHSDELTDDGRAWREYEESRNKEARIMSAAVTVYTQPSCIQCTMTKRQLDKLGIEHNTIDVSADPDAHAYVRGLGYTAAPVVVVNDGEDHWSGFRPDRLKGLVSGE